MAARAAVQALLEGDAELAAAGVQAVYATNSVDTPGEDMFLVVRWDTTDAAFGVHGTDRFSVWAHDRSRDYGRIKTVLARLRTLIPAQVHLAGDDDWVLTTARWLGEGPDLFDDGYGTVTRYADFQAVSRYASPGD
jgi:hypothetical protein